MRRYRRRPKKIRLGTLLVLLLLVTVFLVSCAAGSGPLWVRGFLGYDLKNYQIEPPVETLSNDGEESATLCGMVELLLGNTAELSSFSGSTRAVKLYREQLLVAMLRQHYSLYNCNAELARAAKAAYPYRTLCTLIPKEDFEAFVFRNFGGSRVSHKSGELFEYLAKIGCYTSPVQVQNGSAKITVKELFRTEHTYRMYFTLTAGEKSRSYVAVFLMRQDGSSYFYSLARH